MLYGQSVDVAADGAVVATSGKAFTAVVLTAAAATATLTLYDNPSAASGTVLLKLSAVANTSAVFAPATPVTAGTGIYADIGGADANATVIIL